MGAQVAAQTQAANVATRLEQNLVQDVQQDESMKENFGCSEQETDESRSNHRRISMVASPQRARDTGSTHLGWTPSVQSNADTVTSRTNEALQAENVRLAAENTELRDMLRNARRKSDQNLQEK